MDRKIDKTAAGDRSDLEMFVLWHNARKEEKRILEDIRRHAEIVATFDGEWPTGVEPAEGYRRFYGKLLRSAEEKAESAGVGPFLVVIVRFAEPRLDWRMTRHGLELVNLDMYDLKWKYREWVGGFNRVHGTLMRREAVHDIMLMTGRSLEEWAAGTVKREDVTVLPGQHGWESLAEMFRILNIGHKYVVLWNTMEILASSQTECARCLQARPIPGRDKAYRVVTVGGREIGITIRGIGDGFFDERMARGLLNRRELGADGRYAPGPEDREMARVYHVFYHSQPIDYPAPSAVFARLDEYMRVNGYRAGVPRDREVKFNSLLADWRYYADEAADRLGARNVRPAFPSYRWLELDAEMDGLAARLSFKPGFDGYPVREYNISRAVFEKAPAVLARPMRWYKGARGAYVSSERPRGSALRHLIDNGTKFSQSMLANLAESARGLIAGLDAAKVVHRDIRPENLRVEADGSLSLEGFVYGVSLKKYPCEASFLRHALVEELVQLGGDAVPRPGEWNDRLALAACLRLLPQTDEIRSVIAEFETEAASGKGTVKMNPAKLRARLFLLWLKSFFTGSNRLHAFAFHTM